MTCSQGGQSEKAVSEPRPEEEESGEVPTGFGSVTVTLMRAMLRKSKLFPISRAARSS